MPVRYSMYLFNVSACISKIHLKVNMFETECLIFLPLNLESSSGLFILLFVESQQLGFCLQSVSRIKPPLATFPHRYPHCPSHCPLSPGKLQKVSLASIHVPLQVFLKIAVSTTLLKKIRHSFAQNSPLTPPFTQ